jgi:spore maturation protein CgeB
MTDGKAQETGLDIAFFGSSLVSSWWNGACTYYRGIVRGLHDLGHRITFYEPIAYERQEHRDIPDPDYAQVVIYPAENAEQVRQTVERAATADVVIKTSGVGVFDDVLANAVAKVGVESTFRIFWDVDAPATLGAMEADLHEPLRSDLPRFDAVLTYGGGDPVVRRYTALGARTCVNIYNGLDPCTHYRVPPDPRYVADCALLANRLPDREDRIDEFFFRAASLTPDRTFLLAGNGWEGKSLPPNVRCIGHLGTEHHNAFNSTPTTVLNVTRESMAVNGWSPATRVFEAAGAAACLITDSWEGIDQFFAVDSEILVAMDGADVAAHVAATTRGRARSIGTRAATRALDSHTYDKRAGEFDALLQAMVEAPCAS